MSPTTEMVVAGGRVRFVRRDFCKFDIFDRGKQVARGWQPQTGRERALFAAIDAAFDMRDTLGKIVAAGEEARTGHEVDYLMGFGKMLGQAQAQIKILERGVL